MEQMVDAQRRFKSLSVNTELRQRLFCARTLVHRCRWCALKLNACGDQILLEFLRHFHVPEFKDMVAVVRRMGVPIGQSHDQESVQRVTYSNGFRCPFDGHSPSG